MLEPEFCTSTDTGRILVTMLGMVAEMELGFMKERQHAGIDAAKAKGVYKGRPASLDHARIKELHAAGIGATEIAAQMDCARSAVYKMLSQ